MLSATTPRIRVRFARASGDKPVAVYSCGTKRSQADGAPQGMTSIRMNVRDFDETYDILISKGFKDVNEGKATDTGSSKGTLLVSPSGFSISLSQHIRK